MPSRHGARARRSKLAVRHGTSPIGSSARSSLTESGTKPTVRFARADEAPLVFAIMRAAFAEYAGKLPQESGALLETLEDVQNAMTEGGAVLAFTGDVPVGSARFLPDADGLYVGRVAVLPEHRRRGVASALMRFIEKHARATGKAWIRIGVRESLPSNIALYETLGYETVKVEAHGADRSRTMLKQFSDQ